MKRQKILVTGAGGYIGTVVTQSLLGGGLDVIALDNFSSGYRQPLEVMQKKFGKKRLLIYKKDITKDLGDVFRKNMINAVFHLAASCLVDESLRDPGKFFLNNVYGTLNLLETMYRYKVSRIIFSSTCAVYGNVNYFPVDERHTTQPLHPYGESKLMAEKLIEWYGKLKGLNYIIFRYFNVCGAADDGLMGDSKKPSVLLVQNAVRGAMGIEPFYLTYHKVKTKDGSPIRDFLNISDLADAHLVGLAYLEKGGKGEVINLGTGNGNSVLGIVSAVSKVLGVKFKIKRTKPRLGEYPKMVGSYTKAKKVLGWKPKRSLEDSIKSLAVWYERHPNGWRR